MSDAILSFYAQTAATPLDVAALIWFLACTVGYNFVAKTSGLASRSLIAAIQQQRVRWMSNMAMRGDRFIDIVLVGNLANGNTFFASTSVILLGALSAMLGSGVEAQAVVARLPFTQSSTPLLWDLKILLLMTVFVYAFFKFAWAFRLAHYTMIMVGATPIASKVTEGVCDEHAARTARLAGLAAEHSNQGLRAYYFAIAGIGWFFSPIAFIAATSWVFLIVLRREYFSRSLRAIRGA